MVNRELRIENAFIEPNTFWTFDFPFIKMTETESFFGSVFDRFRKPLTHS